MNLSPSLSVQEPGCRKRAAAVVAAVAAAAGILKGSGTLGSRFQASFDWFV